MKAFQEMIKKKIVDRHSKKEKKRIKALYPNAFDQSFKILFNFEKYTNNEEGD